ncbi:hypothetical protein HQ447_19955 [bacterium]|nr:hypothetical protein [bacterium]
MREIRGGPERRAIKLGRNHGNFINFQPRIDANFQNEIIKIGNFIPESIFIRVYSRPFAVKKIPSLIALARSGVQDPVGCEGTWIPGWRSVRFHAMRVG